MVKGSGGKEKRPSAGGASTASASSKKSKKDDTTDEEFTPVVIQPWKKCRGQTCTELYICFLCNCNHKDPFGAQLVFICIFVLKSLFFFVIIMFP